MTETAERACARIDIAISVVRAAVIVVCGHDCSPMETPFCDAHAAFKGSSSAPTFQCRVHGGEEERLTHSKCHDSGRVRCKHVITDSSGQV